MRRPALLRPSRRPPLLFPLSVLLLFPLVLPFAASTTFSIHPTPANEPRKAPTYFRLSPRAEDFVFGLTRQGIFEANFTSIKYDPQDARQCPIDLVFCNVSSQFVRSPSLERRHAQGTIQSLLLAVRKHHCNGSSNTTIDLECNHEPMPKSPPARVRHAPHADNEMYIAVLVACRCDAFNKPFSLDLQGEAQWLNPNLNPHQHLGWEEVHFPPVALSALILFALEFFLFLAYGFIALRRHLRVPYSFLLILNSAALFKAIHASLTYAYFASVSRTGTRASWYLYSRVSVVAVADVAFICAASAVSSGFCVLPDDWFVDARSPVFSVYIGITLQVLIIITVKLMFPFRYLSVLAYVIAAGTIAVVISLASYRNHHFMRRFAKLIEQAHIYVNTTPIPQMMRFYLINACIILPLYVFKMLSVGLWDYVYRRPDALWGSLELTDAFFLLWYAIATFPWKNSGLYVNMSNNSNERLHQAGAWRASQIERANLDPDDPEDAASMRRRVFAASVASVDSRQPLDSERGTVSNRNVERTTADPQPPWVEWHSGNTLPRPNASTWGLHWPVTRILRRERKLVPVLPSNIVLGSPSESPDTLKLSVGVPTTGPRSVPKRFDEKGVEIAGSSFRSRPLGEASSSIRMLSRLGRSVSNLEQDPASDQAILSRGVLRRFGVSNRTSRTTSRTEGQTQGTCAGSTAPDLSGASSTNQSQVDYSQELPSVLSTNGSCDGILVQMDQGEAEREDHTSD